MATTKIVKRKIEGSQDCSISVNYYHDHDHTPFNTGVRVPDKFVNIETNRAGKLQVNQSEPISSKLEGGKAKNKIILAIKTKVDTVIHRHIANELSLSVDAVRKAFTGPVQPKEVKTMVKLWAEFLDSIKGTIKPPTVQSYNASFNTFQDFLKAKGWQNITPDQFTITHYNKFQSHLSEIYKSNTVAKTLKRFKSFTNYLSDLGVTVGFDKKKIKYREHRGLPISLSEEQLQAVIDAPLTNSLARIRDLFALQCLIGVRISDLKRVDKNINGNKIILETQKNEKVIEIPISPQARAILEKNNYQMPVLSEQRYRDGIKDIYKELFPGNTIQVREGNKFVDVPVWQEISSHDAVRTFITLSAERGMSVNSIAKITGKTVKVLLSNYLVESQKVADKEMEKAWGSAPLKIAR